ncbi:MAG TPA: Smr/MutS family protein [Candidatus Sulfotelmatobacter sp.]|nr:Smr/MutS family protein [Candidatus Sulfotelmatobacter sp.]
MGGLIKTVNLKSDLPSVHQALQRLDQEIAVARQQKHSLLKVVHGYGSSGAGGDIRIAVQRRLHDLSESGRIRSCIFGENWSKSDDASWRLLQTQPELKTDPDLGRHNQGITVVLL